MEGSVVATILLLLCLGLLSACERAPEPVAQQPAPDQPPGLPRWVKISGVVVVVLLVVLVVAMLMGGNHGPGRHQMGAPVGGSQSVAASADVDRLVSARW